MALISLLLVLSAAPSALAHPGRTDANGGHTDRSTGEYHYHHGYPAHQHYDIDGDGKPDCPYDFKDDTRSSSSSGSSSLSGSTGATSRTFTWPTVPPTTRVTDPPATTAAAATRSTSTRAASSGLVPLSYSAPASDDFSGPALAFFLVVAAIYVIVQYIKRYNLRDTISHLETQVYATSTRAKDAQDALTKVKAQSDAECARLTAALTQERQRADALRQEADANRQESETVQQLAALARVEFARQNREATAALTHRINQLTNRRQADAQRKAELMAALRGCYGNDFLLHVAGAPADVFMDADGYPRLNKDPAADPYILHRSATGKYHTPSCTHYPTCSHVHALDVDFIDFARNSCRVCDPEYPDLAWMRKYSHLLDISNP